MRRLIVTALICLSGCVLANGTQVEVIQVMSRPAATLIDTITPLIGEHSSVSAHHDKLIVISEWFNNSVDNIQTTSFAEIGNTLNDAFHLATAFLVTTVYQGLNVIFIGNKRYRNGRVVVPLVVFFCGIDCMGIPCPRPA